MIVTTKILLHSKGNCDIIDITPEVAEKVAEAGVKDGTVTLFVSGSTAGVTTIEYEPGVLSDLQEMWQRIVPDSYLGHLVW